MDKTGTLTEVDAPRLSVLLLVSATASDEILQVAASPRPGQ